MSEYDVKTLRALGQVDEYSGTSSRVQLRNSKYGLHVPIENPTARSLERDSSEY